MKGRGWLAWNRAGGHGVSPGLEGFDWSSICSSGVMVVIGLNGPGAELMVL